MLISRIYADASGAVCVVDVRSDAKSLQSTARRMHLCLSIATVAIHPSAQCSIETKQCGSPSLDWVSLTGSRQWNLCELDELDANRLQLGIVDMSKLTRTDCRQSSLEFLDLLIRLVRVL